MSMKPQPIPDVPSETVRVVRTAFPEGNMYIWLRDTLGTIYQDELFTDLYPDRRQPAYAPWRLALVTVLQFILWGLSRPLSVYEVQTTQPAVRRQEAHFALAAAR